MSENQKTAYERLKEYEVRGCHMLVPSAINADDIAPGFALIVETVLLKPHPRDKEVYANDSTQYDYRANDWKQDCKTGNEMVRIHKQGFDRLAQAAKIDWLPPQLVRDPIVSTRMAAHVEGMIRTSTGELYRVADVKGMDLEIERERLEFQYHSQTAEKREYFVKRDLLQKKAFQQEMCISGAKNRVVKQLLCIANAYSVKDLAKEFVVVRIVPKLDTSDAYTRKRLVDVQIAAMAGIYGLLPNAAPQKAIEMVAPIPDEALRDDDVIDVDSSAATATYPLDKSKTMNPDDDSPPFALSNPPTSTPESLRLDFENSDPAAQAKALATMIAEKGQADFVTGWLKQFKKQPAMVDNLSPANAMKLYDYLVGCGKAVGR